MTQNVKVMGARVDSECSSPGSRRRGGGFLPDAVRRWLLAQCCAAVASCPMQRGPAAVASKSSLALPPGAGYAGAVIASCPTRMLCGGGRFLPVPDAARLWLRCHLSSNVLRTDREGTTTRLRRRAAGDARAAAAQ